MPTLPARGGLYVGTSGWSYPDWRAHFYAGVPRADWLAYTARRFAAVEVNASFYHALKPATLAAWHAQTPGDFRFCIKAHRWITHVERLAIDAAALARERERCRPLRKKLAVVLWQLPQRFARDDARLARFLALLKRWRSVRHAIELRDRSWFDRAVAAQLARAGVANVISDAADWPRWDAVTTDLVYLRLHGHAATYHSAYARSTLARWARRIGGWRDEGRTVYVFFDNTDAGHAPRDALSLQRRCRVQTESPA